MLKWTETGRLPQSRLELLLPSSGCASSVAVWAGFCALYALKAGLNEVAVVLKSSDEIEKMRRAGQVVREVLELVRSHVKPGATTLDLEKVAEARHRRTGRQAGLQGLSRVSLRAVHLSQQRSGARHSIEEAGPERRGHRFGGLRGGGRRLLWRRGHYRAGGREDRARHGAAAAGD